MQRWSTGLAACPGRGSQLVPLVYENYDDATKYARALRKREQKLLYVRAMADHLCPKTMVVAAGPPAFLDASLRYANADPSFPTPGEARVWLKQARYTGRVEAPLPGDCFDLASGELTKDAGMHASFSWEQTSAYIAKYAQRMQANIAAVYRRADEIVVPSMHEAVCAHFERMTNLSTYFNERIDMTLCLDVEGAQGGQWLVDFGLKPRVRRRADGETYQYRYRQEYLLPEKALAQRRARQSMRRSPGIIPRSLCKSSPRSGRSLGWPTPRLQDVGPQPCVTSPPM